MAEVILRGQKYINRVVSHEPGVVGAVRKETLRIGSRAKRKLAMHRDEGVSSVDVSFGKVDGFVNLNDKAALSIEFGHWQYVNGKPTGKYTPGLYILTDAAGLLKGIAY